MYWQFLEVASRILVPLFEAAADFDAGTIVAAANRLSGP